MGSYNLHLTLLAPFSINLRNERVSTYFLEVDGQWTRNMEWIAVIRWLTFFCWQGRNITWSEKVCLICILCSFKEANSVLLGPFCFALPFSLHFFSQQFAVFFRRDSRSFLKAIPLLSLSIFCVHFTNVS